MFRGVIVIKIILLFVRYLCLLFVNNEFFAIKIKIKIINNKNNNEGKLKEETEITYEQLCQYNTSRLFDILQKNLSNYQKECFPQHPYIQANHFA